VFSQALLLHHLGRFGKGLEHLLRGWRRQKIVNKTSLYPARLLKLSLKAFLRCLKLRRNQVCTLSSLNQTRVPS